MKERILYMEKKFKMAEDNLKKRKVIKKNIINKKLD